MAPLVGHTFRMQVLFVLFVSGLDAQSIIHNYNFKHLSVQEGLSQNIVYHFLQDSHGYMWIGTHNGLNLYDGNSVINFLHNTRDKWSISGNFITCILEDSSRQIWIGNENGIDRFNRRNFTFTHFGVDRDDGTKENTYCVPLGFTSASELWFLDTKTKAVRALNTVSGNTSFVAGLNTNNALFYRGNTGHSFHIWSSYDKGTMHQVYDGHKLIREETFFGGKSWDVKEPELIVIYVLQQNDSIAWLSTNKGLIKLNPLSRKFSIFNLWHAKIVRELRFTVLTDDNLLWAATGPDGIYAFDTKTNQFINNFRNDKFDAFTICSDNIVSLYFDKTGNLWCGSYGNGISYTNTKSSFFSSHISKKEMQVWKGNNSISLLGQTPAGNLWCTFENVPGIALLDKNFRILKYQDPLSENGTPYNEALYKLVFETNDEAWCATNKGLYLYNFSTNRMRSVSYELISDEVQGSIWIKDIIRLNDGSLIYSTFAGLYRIVISAGKFEIKSINFLKPGTFNGFGSLFQDKKGLLYVKSLGDFIYILQPSTGERGFSLIRTIDFMPEINQFFSEKDDSLLYIASDNGLYHLNTNSLTLEKDDLDERIPFNNISSFFRQKEKYWLFGDKGLYYFDKKRNESQLFTTEDGLPANEFTLNTLTSLNEGLYAAGTTNGLVSFSPANVRNISNVPRAKLTAIYINDVLDTMNSRPDEIKGIKLTSNQNTFSFDFSSISFSHMSDCSFEYMLSGYDDNWINSGAARFTRYSKIPPGKYKFLLRVTDNLGKKSPYNKELEIEIAKSFWQTNFFEAILFFFLIFSGWLFVKWYSNEKLKKQKRELEKLKAIENERTRIATDMHDDLGAGLSRIKFLSETIGIKKQKQEPIEDDINKIRQYSHDMIDKMGEIVWALNEKNDTISDLLSYSRSYAVEYLAQNGIKCMVETPDHFPSTFVSGEFRRNIFLTIKEALHNVVKHARATEVRFLVHINDHLLLQLEDNGTGFDRTKVRAYSNGLANMESRIKEIGGQIRITSDAGTIIKISVPLNK